MVVIIMDEGIYMKLNINKIHCGDCMELMKEYSKPRKKLMPLLNSII